MKLGDVMGYARANLKRHKLRTFLTMGGVAVGIGALVTLLSLAIGLQDVATQNLKSEELVTRINVLSRSQRAKFMGRRSSGVAPEDTGPPLNDEAIASFNQIDGVLVAYPAAMANLTAEVAERVTNLQLEGIPTKALTESYQDALVSGSYWDAEVTGNVCVLPSGLVEDIGLGPEWVVGKEVLVSELRAFFKYKSEETEELGPDGKPERRLVRPTDLETETLHVLGVYDSDRFNRGGAVAHAPHETVTKLSKRFPFGFGGGPKEDDAEEGTYPVVVVKVGDVTKIEAINGEIKKLGFATITINDILQVIGIFFVVVKLILGFFGSIGLVVAIFGIANTMVMAVIERTREIGVLKALGARNRDVRRLFLAEACTIGFGGGLMGVGGGWLIGAVLNAAAAFFFKEQLGGESYAFFQLSSWLILGAIGIATFVAAVAGIYPAARAARLDPVESLRVE